MENIFYVLNHWRDHAYWLVPCILLALAWIFLFLFLKDLEKRFPRRKKTKKELSSSL